MVDAAKPSETTQKGVRFFVGLAIVMIGYSTALIGCLAFFKIPLLITTGMMLGGLLVATILAKFVDHNLAFPAASRVYSLTNLIGSLLIVAIMVAFANSNWKTWYIHPAGFQGIWLVLVGAGFHSYAIQKCFTRGARISEMQMTDYDEKEASNPYAPPMRQQTRTNKAMDTKGSVTAL